MSITAFDIYSHEEIYGVLSELVPFQHQLLNHFGSEMLFESETIDFDKISDDLRVAIYVAPELSAKATKTRGFQTKSYKAPYTKQKETVDINQIFKRAAGEPINSFPTPAAKYQAQLVAKAVTMRVKHQRLLELSASQLLLNGAYTATSELYPEPLTIDFERKAGNQLDFTTLNANGGVGKRVWGSTGGTATVSPMDDLEEFMDACQEHIDTLYLSDNVWKQLKADPKFKDSVSLINANRTQNRNFEVNPVQGTIQGLKYRGTLTSNGTEIYTYNGVYQHPVTGTITKYIPDGMVVGVPSAAFGTVAYGAIQHGLAGWQAMKEFWNNWVEDEFGAPYLQFQSAPMLVHTKINSTFAHKVM